MALKEGWFWVDKELDSERFETLPLGNESGCVHEPEEMHLGDGAGFDTGYSPALFKNFFSWVKILAGTSGKD